MIPGVDGRHSCVQRRDTQATVVLECGHQEVAAWPLVGCGRPDLAMVDELARLQLAARRLGLAIRLRDVSGELRELLDLAGLAEVMTGAPRLRQAGGETEGGEEGGVEEVVQPGDPIP